MKLVVDGCLPLYSNKATLARDESGGLAVCRAHRGLPVGFLLLRYSV